MEWTHTLAIDTPPVALWALTMDVEALPQISPTTMTRVERLDPGPLVPGHRVRIEQPGQPVRTWTVTSADAPHRFVWQTRVGPVSMVATHVIEPTGTGSLNTLGLALTGWGSGLLGLLLRGRLTQVLTTENAGFKRVAESSPLAGS